MRPARRLLKLEKDIFSDKVVYWHLSDEQSRTIIPFLNFIIECIDEHALKRKTVEGRAYSLKKWYQYLSDRGIEALDATDDVLKAFREHLFDSRIARNRSDDEKARRRTINLDLRNIYIFYAWLQKNDPDAQNVHLLGREHCQIKSSLLEIHGDRSLRSDRERHPLVYPNVGEKSKHRLGFVPQEPHRAALTEYFYERHDPNIAKRNCLIYELAWAVGWRRGSILSLTIEQFSRSVVLGGDGDSPIFICPVEQKLGYANSFPVEHNVAIRVLHYIENERAEIISRTKSKSSEIFLSQKYGSPLQPGSVSCIFNKARHALSWPPGAGLHGARRGFANNYLEREIDGRLELGLDTGHDTVAMSLANALGQENLASQAAYVRDAQRRIRGTATFRDKVENARLADENSVLRAENAQLLRLIKGIK